MVRLSLVGVTAALLMASWGCSGAEGERVVHEDANDENVSAVTSCLKLAWNDDSTDETDFELERATGSEDFVSIAKLGADVATYEDCAVSADLKYCYRVRAVNAAGPSAWSNGVGEVCAQPKLLVACGDGVCDPSESCGPCPRDCGACPGGFPVVLEGAVPEEKSATIMVAKPEGATSATLELQNVFDGDYREEGSVSVNGHSPITLFGRVRRGDRTTRNIALSTPVEWWVNGENTLRFVHDRTRGYRVGGAVVTFLGGSSPPATSNQSILTGQTPGLLNLNDGGQVYELGMKFRASAGGRITAIRFFKAPGEGSGHVGNLWSASGSKLATVSFVQETQSGWQEAKLSSPINVEANVLYVVSVGTDAAGNYVATNDGLAASIVRGDLTAVADGANGVYVEGVGQFPTKSWSNSNYFRDVVFVRNP